MFEWVGENLLLVAVAAGAVIFGIAAVLEHEEGQSFRDTGANVKDKSSKATGGVLGSLFVILMGFVGAAQAAGQTVVGFAFDLLGGLSPEALGGLVVALLGTLGVEGSLGLGGYQFLGIALIILGLAMGVTNERKMRGSRR